MKKIINSKWNFIITLSLVTAILLIATMSFAFKSGRLNAAEETVRQVTRVQHIAARNSHIALAKKASSEATVESVVEVAAATAAPAAQETPAAEEVEVTADAALLPEVPVEEVQVAEEVVAAPAEMIVYEEPVLEIVHQEVAAAEAPADLTAASGEYYSAADLKFNGVIYSGGWRWTWYSQNVLPGGGLSIPGRHVDENGYVCDENGRICLASEDLPYGTVVSTPFGKEGCVYDCGCDYGTLDVYVNF